VGRHDVPSIANSAFAKGDVIAVRALGKSELPTSITGFPGWNMSDCGLGVDCVWMNMVLFCPAHGKIYAINET
jgi:hypothetical protein